MPASAASAPHAGPCAGTQSTLDISSVVDDRVASSSCLLHVSIHKSPQQTLRLPCRGTIHHFRHMSNGRKFFCREVQAHRAPVGFALAKSSR